MHKKGSGDTRTITRNISDRPHVYFSLVQQIHTAITGQTEVVTHVVCHRDILLKVELSIHWLDLLWL